MDKKTIEKITEDYSTFNISKEKIPAYENPYQFSKTFKKCSIVEYKSISYSNTTVQSKIVMR
ncbi:MAG: hypothetical protein HY808_09780 [Nitrospirae bacterium]|nr:hypothetical protein [Nitrospirota bacterium]